MIKICDISYQCINIILCFLKIQAKGINFYNMFAVPIIIDQATFIPCMIFIYCFHPLPPRIVSLDTHYSYIKFNSYFVQ